MPDQQRADRAGQRIGRGQLDLVSPRVQTLEAGWKDLTPGQWDDLAVYSTFITTTYIGGTWEANTGFTPAPVPIDSPGIVYPFHQETDVPLTPTIQWNLWTSPGTMAGIWFGLRIPLNNR